jgi:heme A synthase
VTTRARALRTLATALIVLLSVAALDSAWPADAQTRRTTTTTTTTTTTIPVAPGETAPNGGPLLVPGDVASDAPGAAASDDNTGTVVALVITGLLVVALLLALLTYWFWRNTRPTKLGGTEPGPATAEG